MIAPSGHGYVQQGLGAADIFATLYFAELRLDPADPAWSDRDRFLLSTAHNTAIFYATLAARGCIPAESLATYTQDGSPLEVNASERLGPVIEATCGSLGQGLSVAVGMALSLRRRRSEARVYVVLGDGEMQEGQVWEAAMAAGSHRLANLCVVLDDNRMQVAGHVDGVLDMKPVAEKWRSFGFRTEEIDGNDVEALLGAFARARASASGPTCILAQTLVGKGAPSLEGVLGHTMRPFAGNAAPSARGVGVVKTAEAAKVGDFIARGSTSLPRLYGDALLAAARRDPRIVCLSADLRGPTETDLFAQELPDRFLEAGIAEANMIGMAAGMARCGDIPFVHSLCRIRDAPLLRPDRDASRLSQTAGEDRRLPAGAHDRARRLASGDRRHRLDARAAQHDGDRTLPGADGERRRSGAVGSWPCLSTDEAAGEGG